MTGFLLRITNLLQIEKGEIVLMTEKIPDYFKLRLPDIYKIIKAV
jgi:hypothetical protein